MDTHIIPTILIVLATTLAVISIFRFFKIPVILGYIIAGILIGPHALGLLEQADEIREIAEFGIVFLMFTVGLEFSLSKLVVLRKSVFILGGLQVSISVLITTLIAEFLGMSLLAATVVGGVVAMSSTAVVVKQLVDQFELNTKHGANSVGILLFQDLAVIPFIILVTTYSKPTTETLWFVFTIALVKGIFAIGIILLAGRFVLRPLFHYMAATKVTELFTLMVLVVALTAAWFTSVMGLSFVLGAFVAGIMLGETEYRHQIELEIRPFRDILLGLFFISIGMLLVPSSILTYWPWVLLLLSGLIIGKGLLIYILCLLQGDNKITAARSTLILSHGGEFGFAILTLALAANLLPRDYAQVILASLLISLILAPILISNNGRLAKKVLQDSVENDASIENTLSALSEHLQDHIIICGYGRVGQNIARFIEAMNLPYLGIDLDPAIVKNAVLAGDNVTYGNASHLWILDAARLAQAKAMVVSFDNVHATMRVLQQVRSTNKEIPIFVRCKDQHEMDELSFYGATEIVAEIFEESFSLAQRLLTHLQVPQQAIASLFNQVRQSNYRQLSTIFPGDFIEGHLTKEKLRECIKPVVIASGSFAENKTLADLKFSDYDVEVVTVRKMNRDEFKPDENYPLQANDVLVLYGQVANLVLVEDYLQTG